MNFIKKCILSFEDLLPDKLYAFFLGSFTGIVAVLLDDKTISAVAIVLLLACLALNYIILLIMYYLRIKGDKK